MRGDRPSGGAGGPSDITRCTRSRVTASSPNFSVNQHSVRSARTSCGEHCVCARSVRWSVIFTEARVEKKPSNGIFRIFFLQGFRKTRLPVPMWVRKTYYKTRLLWVLQSVWLGIVRQRSNLKWRFWDLPLLLLRRCPSSGGKSQPYRHLTFDLLVPFYRRSTDRYAKRPIEGIFCPKEMYLYPSFQT